LIWTVSSGAHCNNLKLMKTSKCIGFGFLKKLGLTSKTKSQWNPSGRVF